MNGLSDDDSSWAALETWLLTEDGRNISSGNLNSDASQTVISFQAATLDWQATADFESELSGNLANIADESDGDFTVQLSGRSLILHKLLQMLLTPQ